MSEIENNFLKKVGNNYLTEYQIYILNKFNIPYKECNNLREIIMLIDNYINNEDVDSEDIEILDNVASEINERNYYLNTNK